MLNKIGFSKDQIGETIVSTYGSDGQPNAAPMGIVTESGHQLLIRPFVSSLTYKNMQSSGCAVVNVTSDAKLFYLTAFKEANPNGRLSADMFDKAETVDAPKLKHVEATIEVAVVKEDSFGTERAEFLCNVKHVETSETLPRVYCRAQFATIEAIIHATRIKPFLKGNKNEQEHASKLLDLVEVCRDVVDRTAPDSCYSEIMADLIQRISLWRQQSESYR